ncbi:DUF7264 domain-containing protein [Gordonia westfalica]|uniref:LtfC/p132/Gp6 beta-sandwich domain-containing protein n=1 Tax=Gordonia westfalica TaxID=158898 RepID=A0A1H2EL35_9ACTN|nr:hypothetical protein [Gordonia westfalica]SDT95673.1 hypothetical protein SAMN04488548_13315 [Gordonia westfalica]
MTTVTLGWEGTKAEIPLYQNSDLVFSLDPIDATSGNITSWPVGAASTLYFFEGDPVRNATTPIISIPGVVEPPSIDYVVQQETLAPSSGGPPTSCSRCRCPKPPPRNIPSTTGKQSAVSEWTDDNGTRHWIDDHGREHVDLTAEQTLHLDINYNLGE